MQLSTNNLSNDLQSKLKELNLIRNNWIQIKIDVSKYEKYSRNNKEDLNKLSKQFIDIGDWRSHFIKNSLKKDLIKKLLYTCECSIIAIELLIVKTELKINQTNSINLKQIKISNILNLVYPEKTKYISSFDNIDEGIRCWGCLICLIEEGSLTIEQLNKEYGFNIIEK